MERRVALRLYSSCKRARCAHTVPSSSGGQMASEKGQLKSVADIPGPSGIYAWPYIGTAFLFHPFTEFRPHQINLFFHDLHRKYGKIVKFRKGSKWAVFLFDPYLIEIASRYEGKYPERPPLPLLETYTKRSGQRPGLSQLSGREWYDQRKPVQDHAMKPRVVAEYLPSQTQVANDLVSTIGKLLPDIAELNKLLLRYTAESTALVCFNTRLGFLDDKGTPLTQEQDELLSRASKFQTLVAHSLYTFPVFRLYPNKLYKDFVRTYEGVTQTGRRHVEEIYADLCKRKETGTLDPHEPNLLLHLLNETNLSKDICLKLMTGFYTVATENVSKSLSLWLWLLAKNRDKQDRLYQEIVSQCGASGDIPASTLAHMPYLKASFKEASRVAFPRPVGSVRIMDSDFELAGYYIPKGTEVHFGHNILCRSEEYFDSPECYWPERWLREETINPRHHYQSLIVTPFGFGVRNCPGRRFAEQQLNIAVVKLLQTFVITLPDPQEELSLVYNITAAKDTPLRLNFELRREVT